MFWKGKIEINTMQVFLDLFNAIEKSYFIYFNKALCKFLQKTGSIYYLKSSKNTYFGSILIGDIDFLQF